MASTEDDARESMKEAIFYFYQLENATELETTPPSDLFSYLASSLPAVSETWTSKKDAQLLQTSEMVDSAIEAAINTMKEMKWELVARAINLGSTSIRLEYVYERRFRKIKEKDGTTISPSIFDYTAQKHKTMQNSAKIPGFREPPSESDSESKYAKKEEKKRSASSDHSSPAIKRFKPYKEDPESSFAKDISSIPAYSKPSFSATAFTTTRPHLGARVPSAKHGEHSTRPERQSFSDLQAEARELGRDAQLAFQEFTCEQEKIGKSKIQSLKFCNRFPAQAARIREYTHFDLQHVIKKAGLHRYSKLNKPEMLDKYLVYMYDKYKALGSRELDRELSQFTKSETMTSDGW